MNPFDTPPSTPPVSLTPPAPESPRSGGRGRLALVAAVTAGVVGAGAIGIGQLVSADRPSVSEEPTDEPTETTIPDEPAEDETGDDRGVPTIEGEIVIDLGDGETLVIDLGEVAACLPDLDQLPDLDGFPDLEDLPDLGELDDLDDLDDLPFLDELPGLDGTTITITGPDGLEVVTLGDDGSVTITSEDGEVTVETDGDAGVGEIDVLGDIDLGDLDLGNLEDVFGEDALGDLEELLGEGLFEDLEEILGGDLFGEEALGEGPVGESDDLDQILGAIGGGALGELFGDLDDCLRGALDQG